MAWLTPQVTFYLLAPVLALHLLLHRLAKRHISFAEVIRGAVLALPAGDRVPGGLLMGAQLLLSGVQIAGSIWIRRLSPDWAPTAV